MRRKQFSKSMTIMVPPGFPAAIATAARAQCSTPSEFVRQAVLERLRKSGAPFVPEANMGTTGRSRLPVSEVA
jgi:hypothetical protein